MVISTTTTALPIFRSQGFSFITSTDWNPSEGRFGILSFIYGTLVTSAIALVIAVPLSLGVSLFLTEVAPRWMREPVGYVVDLLAAVPSVVYGLWGVFILLPLFLQPAAEFLGTYLGFLPIFTGPASGISFFGAGVVLAIMIIPIISSLCREVFMAVPTEDRYAAYALGRHTVGDDPRSRPAPEPGGHRGCGHAGLGSALGETIAVALLIGSRAQITASILQPGYSMAVGHRQPVPGSLGRPHPRPGGRGRGLFGITILVNIAARALVWRTVERMMARRASRAADRRLSALPLSRRRQLGQPAGPRRHAAHRGLWC